MYSFNGKDYVSYYEMAKDLGIPPSLFYNRMNRGWSIKEIINGVRDERIVVFNGKYYKSKNEAAKSNNMSIGKFNRIYNSGKRTSEICIDGIYYNSKTEAMKTLNLSYKQINKILNNQEDNQYEEVGKIIVFDKKLNKKISFLNEYSLCDYYGIEFDENLFKDNKIQEVIDKLEQF